MKRFVIRGVSTGLLVFSIVLAGIFIVVPFCGYFLLASAPVSAGIKVMMYVCTTVVLAFGILLQYMAIFNYCCNVTIDEKTITCVRPFRKGGTISLEQITFWGHVSYMARGSMFYFLTVEKATLLNYLEAHEKECIQIFGDKRVNQLKISDAGRIRLAIGTYIRLQPSVNETLFVLDYVNRKRTGIFANAIKKDGMVTGPMLIDRASEFETEMRYRPQ